MIPDIRTNMAPRVIQYVRQADTAGCCTIAAEGYFGLVVNVRFPLV